MISNGRKDVLKFVKSEDFDATQFVETQFIPFLENKVSINKEDLFVSAQLFKIENENDLENSQEKMDCQETIEDFIVEFNQEEHEDTLYFVLNQVSLFQSHFAVIVFYLCFFFFALLLCFLFY